MDKYNKQQLRKGISIELEHTKNVKKARSIAHEHLEENKNYYKGACVNGKNKLVRTRKRKIGSRNRKDKFLSLSMGF